MTTITVHFQADSWHEIRYQMYAALGLDYPAQPSTALNDAPVTTLGQIFDEEEAKAPDPIPEPAPKKATSRKPRSTQTATPPAPIDALGVGVELTPEPAPEPEPEASEPARDLPTIEVLKAIVTQAVRLAQKKEGPAKILELLPEFKTKTGLGFVMEAEEKHRDALADLIDAAGLTEAAA